MSELARNRIAVIRQGDRPRINAALADLVAETFPQHQVDDIDVLAEVQARRLLLARTLAGTVVEHGWSLATRRTTVKKAWITSRAFATAADRVVAETVSPHTHVATLQSQSLFPAAVAGVPHFVYTDHAHLVNLGYPGFDGRSLAGRGFVVRERDVLRSADRVFVRSRHVRDVLVSTYGIAASRVIDVGVGPNTPLPSPSPGDEPRTWHGGRIVFVGVDWERKGGPTLLGAFEQVRDEHPTARLEIVGCEPPGCDLPGVTVHGRLPEAAVAELLADCDVFCLPTTSEPFGVAFVEAMHAGLAIVGTDLGAVPDMVRDGETGRLVPVGDAEALGRALTDLLADPEGTMQMGDAARELARRRYHWPRVMAAIREGMLPAMAAAPAVEPRDAMRVATLIVGMRVDGGAENVVKTLVSELSRTSCSATVVTFKPIEPAMEASLRTMGADVVVLPARRLVSPRRFVRLLRTLRAGRYDVIHTHLTGANMLGLAAGSLLRIPVVVTLHSTRSSGDRHWYHGRLERLLIRRAAARVIAVGDETATARRAVLGDDVAIHVLPNAVAPVAAPDPATCEALRHDVMRDPEAPLFITVGRLTPAKGHAQLIRAFAAVRADLPAAELAIVGDGALRDALDGLVAELGLADSVHLLGRRSDARRLVAAADVFVMSSVWEGLPMALLEAMQAGVPVVATDVGDVARVLEGTPSRVVAPGDHDALADAMTATVRDIRAGRDLGSPGRRVVSARYSSEAWADRVLEHYRAVTGDPVTAGC